MAFVRIETAAFTGSSAFADDETVVVELADRPFPLHDNLSPRRSCNSCDASYDGYHLKDIGARIEEHRHATASDPVALGGGEATAIVMENFLDRDSSVAKWIKDKTPPDLAFHWRQCGGDERISDEKFCRVLN